MKGSSAKEVTLNIGDFLFNGADPVNLLDYDVIGFDADQCFVKYHLQEFTKLGVLPSADYLVKHHGYPPEYRDFSEDDLNFLINYAVLDKKNGLLLKLGVNKLVLRAYSGYRRLSE